VKRYFGEVVDRLVLPAVKQYRAVSKTL